MPPNMIYRSGRATQRKLEDNDSSQIRVEASRGIVVTGNTLTAGRDDNMDPKGTSPKFGIVLRNLKNSVISNNAMHGAALEKLILDQGKHGEGVTIQANEGSLFANDERQSWDSF